MKTTIQFEMKGNDVRLLRELREPVKIVAGDYSIEGFVAPKEWNSWNEVTCDVLEKEGGSSNITIPVVSLTVSRDWSDEIQVVYGIGEDTPVYITAADRRRYHALEGLRAYRARLVNCVTDHAYYDEYDREYVSCGHGPEKHGPDGCNETVDWYEGTRIYCGCEHYTKPSPLMRI